VIRSAVRAAAGLYGGGMRDVRIARQFVALTFVIAYGFAGALIVAATFGYRVNNVVTTLPEFAANVPFALYILSPAIASYIVLRRNGRVSHLGEWLRWVFAARGPLRGYVLIALTLTVYFILHVAVSGPSATAVPWYMFFLSIPGNLIIGGMEESGWMTSLQPAVDHRWGYLLSSLIVGLIWLAWHVPLFFIPGTNHQSGAIDFAMFALQIMAFRFFYGAVLRVSSANAVFLCIVAHTAFNAMSFTVGVPPATWPGTLVANAAVVAIALASVALFGRKAEDTVRT
jgi:membrane protease YdiL (CAAX protease family)